jgi:predicted outer membrane protein
MRSIMLLLALAMCACSAGGAAPRENASAAAVELSDAEKSLIDAIAANDIAEIELSKLAKIKSESRTLREFAQTIIDDDSANYAALFKLCLQQRNPIAPQLDERHREILRRLRTTSASGVFGRRYLDTIMLDQTERHARLEQTSADALNDELAQFAAATQQMVEKHEQMARDLGSSSDAVTFE